MGAPLVGNAFTVAFDTRAITAEHPITMSGPEIMDRMVKKGLIAFQLSWERVFVAQLAVEDDIVFLCDALDDLPGLVAGQYPHFVHIGDGELEVTSTLVQDEVRMNVLHTPHLDRRFLHQYTFTALLKDYVSAWRSLVHQLEIHAT
ncbi:hypothetical protein [Paraliomyxa miuraensis]|uniref:hypothetical protein n=1 Tax=Paraliomyxa miuraensis TaxID=376150 RepID=UPI00225A080A|nr:hypothetical protein [Paraliomyxa miuraensis]MCX4240082.1 hypothetical protein [Paraliomyxa miuraensis]